MSEEHKVCPICSKQIPNYKVQNKVCSNTCRLIFNKTKKMTVSCLCCKKEFETSIKINKKFCSIKCYRSMDSKRIKTCSVCEGEFVARSKKAQVCSPACRNRLCSKKTKQCKGCGGIKTREEFGENRLKRGACIRAYCKPCSLKKQSEWVKNNYFMYLMSLVKRSRRNKDKHPCDIDALFLESLYKKQKGLCALSGIPLVCDKHSDHSVSVDRIDSNYGYVKDNIHLVCKQVNFLKHKLKVEDLYYYCETILQWRDHGNN